MGGDADLIMVEPVVGGKPPGVIFRKGKALLYSKTLRWWRRQNRDAYRGRPVRDTPLRLDVVSGFYESAVRCWRKSRQ